MEKEEILKKAQKKHPIGEMEKEKVNKGGWIALVVAGIIAVGFIITEGALGHFPAMYAIGAVCYGWASSFYLCQYFVAKRPWQVLIGAVLHGLAFVTMIVLFVLFNTIW